MRCCTLIAIIIPNNKLPSRWVNNGKESWRPTSSPNVPLIYQIKIFLETTCILYKDTTLTFLITCLNAAHLSPLFPSFTVMRVLIMQIDEMSLRLWRLHCSGGQHLSRYFKIFTLAKENLIFYFDKTLCS